MLKFFGNALRSDEIEKVNPNRYSDEIKHDRSNGLGAKEDHDIQGFMV